MKLLFVLAPLGSTVTPVQKVIQMLQEMHAKGIKEKEAEVKIFEEYTEWVNDQVRDKGYETQTLKDNIAKFQAEIQKTSADVNSLTSEINALNADIVGWENQAVAATEIRDAEKSEHGKVSKDYEESVSAIQYAKTVLQSQNFDRKQAGSLLQSVAKIPEAHKALIAFIQGHDITQGTPEVAGYEFQSGGIIKLLDDLGKKFRTELATANREEANAAHAYNMELLNLRDQIKNATEHRDEKITTRAQRKTAHGEFSGELADAQQVLAATEEYVRNVQTTFSLKTRDYKVNQDVRAEELNALTQAIEIISGKSISGHADTHLPALNQRSFLQTFLATDRPSTKAASFLEEKAASLHSKVLQLAAFKISAGGPFDKIARIIQDLIARLETEAGEEADHKKFCDTELKANKLSREEKTRKSEELTTKIETLTANINNLAQNIADLSKQETELREAVAKFTDERNKEKKVNEQTIVDAKEAQGALNQALDVLKAFYEKAGAELVQTKSKDKQVPEMARYTGQQDSKKGVVGMLQVIQADFARLEADTSASESQAQREFDEYTIKAKKDIEAKHKDAFDKTMLKDRKEHEKKLTKKDLRNVSQELKAANDYYDQLKPQCLEVHVSHEERMRLRQEEIDALKEAYEILDQKA